jgi:hypothetical protein
VVNLLAAQQTAEAISHVTVFIKFDLFFRTIPLNISEISRLCQLNLAETFRSSSLYQTADDKTLNWSQKNKMGNYRSKATGAARTPLQQNTHLTIGQILSPPETHTTIEQFGEPDLIEVSVPPERYRMPEQTGNQAFEVIEVSAPNGARSGIPFEVTVNGQSVMVCPPNIIPGQKFRIRIPAQSSNYHPLEAINVTKLVEACKDGWMTSSG